MAGALFYIASFIFSVSMLIAYPKKSEKVNFIVDALFSYVSILCVTSVFAILLNLVKIPINLFSMGGLFIVCGAAIGLRAAHKKKMQHHYLKKSDAIAVLVLTLAVGILSLYIFTPYIHANYYNSVDPYNHFLYAMKIVRSESLSGMFFNPLYNGMFIELLAWAMPQSWAYKAFILSDIYHIILELLFFYAVLLIVVSHKVKKYTLLGISILYWCSFLMLSFLWGFVYWSMAAMLAMYVFILLKLYVEKVKSTKVLLGFMIPGVFAVTICYVEFTPGIVLTILVTVLYNYAKNEAIQWNGKYIKYGIVIILMLILLALLGYHFVFYTQGVNLFQALQMGEQQNIGLELVLMLPLVMYILFKNIRNQMKLTALQLAYLVNLLLQLVFTILSICHIISTYYLQKNYFILFFLSIVVIFEQSTIWTKKNTEYVMLYSVAVLGFFVLSYDGKNSSTFSLQQSTVAQNLDVLTKYDFHDGVLSDNGKIYLMQYAMEELCGDGVVVPLIASTPGRRGICSWLEATYDTRSFIWLEDAQCSEEIMEDILRQSRVTHFIIFYDDLLYIDDLNEYFNSFERVYSNDAGFVGKFE